MNLTIAIIVNSAIFIHVRDNNNNNNNNNKEEEQG